MKTNTDFNKIVDFINSTNFNSSEYKPFIDSLMFVLENELSEVNSNYYEKDMKPFWSSIVNRAETVKDVGLSISKYFKESYSVLSNEGLKSLSDKISKDSYDAFSYMKTWSIDKFNFLKESILNLPSAISGLFTKVTSDYKNLETNDEKVKYMFWIIVFAIVLKESVEAGYNTPDKDWVISGAGHRNFLTHSFVMPLFVSALGYYLLRILDNVEDKLKDDTQSLELCLNLKMLIKIGVFGFGAGVATHLFVDTFIDTGGTIRFKLGEVNLKNIGFDTNSLLSGTRVDDMAYTALMTFFSALNSRDNFEKVG